MLNEPIAPCQAKETLASSKTVSLGRSYKVIFREVFNKSLLVYQCISNVLYWQGSGQT